MAQEIGCSERTVYRDLEVLSFAGVPWFFDELEKCIRVRADFRFPTLNLTDEEVIGQAIATTITKTPGINASPGSSATTNKISATSSEQARKTLELASNLINVFDLKLVDHSRHHEMIRTAQLAVILGKQLSGFYESPYESQPSKLSIHPYRICLIKNAWYIIGHLDGEGIPKTFRIARFKTLKKLERNADVPKDFDLQKFFGNAWSVYRGESNFDVQLKFVGTAAKVVKETIWHHTQVVKQLKDHSVQVIFNVDGLDEILNWILTWTGKVTIEAPEELKNLYLERLKTAIKMNQ